MSASPALISLVFLFIALLVVIGLIVGIVLWATSGRGSSQGMSCGSCGYGVRGLSQLSCPECGADLREVGIQRGGSPGRRLTGIVLTCICGAMVLLGCGVTGLAFVWAAAPNSPSKTTTLQPTPGPATSSGTAIRLSPIDPNAAPGGAAIASDDPGPKGDTASDEAPVENDDR